MQKSQTIEKGSELYLQVLTAPKTAHVSTMTNGFSGVQIDDLESYSDSQKKRINEGQPLPRITQNLKTGVYTVRFHPNHWVEVTI